MKIFKNINVNLISIFGVSASIFLVTLIPLGIFGIVDDWDGKHFLILYGVIVLLVLSYEVIKTPNYEKSVQDEVIKTVKQKDSPPNHAVKSVQDEIKWALSEFKFKDSKEVINVLADFGEFIADLTDSQGGSTAYYDVKKLPHPKAKIMSAFGYGLQFPDKNYRENLAKVIFSLAYFQKNVGDKPIYIFNSKFSDEIINTDSNDINKIMENAQKFLGDEKTQKKKKELDMIYKIELGYYKRMIDTLRPKPNNLKSESKQKN